MRILTKEEILQEMKLKTEDVPLGNGKVIVSEIGSTDYMNLWMDPKLQKNGEVDMARFTPSLVSYCVVDENGNRVFSEEDVEKLCKSSHNTFNKIAEVAKRLNGLNGEEVKNSEDSQQDVSSSDSV